MLEVHFPDYNCQSFSLLTQPRRGWNVSHVYYAYTFFHHQNSTTVVRKFSEWKLFETCTRLHL